MHALLELRTEPWARRALLAAALALAVLGVGVGRAAADPAGPHPVLREFMPSGKYVFVGPHVPNGNAAVYFSQRAASYLVRGTALGVPILVRTGSSSVESFPDEKIICRPDGGCDVRADVTPTELGRFQVEGAEIVIRVPGLEGRLRPRPPTLGWVKGPFLRAAQPEYDRDARAFNLDASVVASLRAGTKKVQVFVYFGTWCSTCALLMGRILKLEEAVSPGNPNVTFDYYAVPPVPEFYRNSEVTLRSIDRIPTGLIYVDGQYAGRLVGSEWSRPEQALSRFTR